MATEIKARVNGGRVIPVIPMLDPIVHRLPDMPFCSDVLCPCHDDPVLLQEYFMQPFMDGLLTKSEAENLYYGRQV